MSNNNYEIILDYKKDVDASEIFETLYDFTLALNKYNNTILGFVSKEIKTSSSLIEVNHGSVKSKIQDIIKKIPDNSKLDFYMDNPREIIKNILKDGRKVLFKLADLNETQEKKEEILYKETETLLKNSDLSKYGYKIKRDELYTSVNDVYNSVKNTDNKIKINENKKSYTLNDCFNYDVKKTYEKNTREHTIDAYLKIKKPVLIGKSKWEFIYNHSIEAVIKDKIWLNKLKKREIPILSGDIMHCKLKSIIIRNDENEIIESSYHILKVYDVIPPDGNIDKLV